MISHKISLTLSTSDFCFDYEMKIVVIHVLQRRIHCFSIVLNSMDKIADIWFYLHFVVGEICRL